MAKKEEIEEHARQNKELVYFPIIGEYQREHILVRLA